MSTQTQHVVEVTKEGLADLQAELAELRDVKLPAIIQRVAQAREHGDLSENAEYHDAKEDQRLTETRIDELEAVVAKAKIVKHTRSHTVIGMGSTVVVQKKGSKKKLTITIVGEFEANPLENKISGAAPLGAALMKKKKGDKVIVHAPAGDVEYTVLEIK